jgi:hypothetical protein
MYYHVYNYPGGELQECANITKIVDNNDTLILYGVPEHGDFAENHAYYIDKNIKLIKSDDLYVLFQYKSKEEALSAYHQSNRLSTIYK